MKTPSKIEQSDTIWQVADYISQGHTKQETMDYIVSEIGMSQSSANRYYHNALKEVIMDDDLLVDYKKTIQQQNYDRLERIIRDTITGDTGNKKVCISAIAELNKMAGSYDDKNKVTIAKDKGGDEVIQITFN